MKKSKNNKKLKITKNMKIINLIKKYPELEEFLISKNLYCLHCPLSAFETLEDICKRYNILWKEFKKEIVDFLKKKK